MSTEIADFDEHAEIAWQFKYHVADRLRVVLKLRDPGVIAMIAKA